MRDDGLLLWQRIARERGEPIDTPPQRRSQQADVVVLDKAQQPPPDKPAGSATMRVSGLQDRLGDDPPVVFRLHLQNDPHVVAYFTVDGEPQSKARPRWNPESGGKPRTPEQTKQAEKNVAWAFRRKVGQFTPSATDAFGVFAVFHCGTRQRRDVDNMIKLLLDALNGVVWKDDMQVTEVAGRLLRGVQDDPRTEVLIYRTLLQPSPTRPCRNCGKPYPHYPSQEAKGRQFCGADCGYEWRTKQNRRVCEHCQKEFKAKPSDVGKYCSKTCHYAAANVTLTCINCGKTYSSARSLARTAQPACSKDCRAEYWRKHRAKAAKGSCSQCGGPTSKKTYKRCNACRLQPPTRPKES